MWRGGGPEGGELGGLRRLLPFKRVVPALPPLPGAGRGLGKFVFVAGKAPDGRRGRAGAAVLPSCFREAVGAASLARRGGLGARLPVPGRLEEAGRGGREPSGARGARRPQRWDFSAREESGAGARPRRRSADSGAAGAGGGGGGEAAGKEEEGESRSRPASMGRLAPRPLLLALLSLGECARGPVRRRGLGRARGDWRGAAAARGLERQRGRGRSRETWPGSAGGRARLGRGRGAARSRARGASRRPVGRASPPCAGGEWPAAGFPRPSLPVSRQLPAHLELPARKVPAVPALVPGLRAEICGVHLPRHGRERQNRAPHTLPRAQLPFQGSERIHQLPSPKVTGWPRALQSEWVCGALRCVSCN